MKDLVQIAALFAAIISVLGFILNIVMAAAVYYNASGRLKASRRLYLLSPEWWGLIVFVFSIAGFACYWAIHHSNLSQDKAR